MPYDDAREWMKRGIQRLAASYGRLDITKRSPEFWLRMVRGFLPEGERTESIACSRIKLIEKVRDKNLILDYYSAELLASPEAKSDWVEPDMKPLPFPR